MILTLQRNLMKKILLANRGYIGCRSFRIDASSARDLSSVEPKTTLEDVNKTCLYDLHVKLGGRMIAFSGYLLPVQYGSYGIAASHQHTRQHASVFDVSHMLQTQITGKDMVEFIEMLTVGDIEGLPLGQGTLSVMTNDRGGIIDDLIIVRAKEGYLYIVSNAGCRDKDLSHMQNKLTEFRSNGKDANIEIIDDHGLIALQGPGSAKVLQPLIPTDLSKLAFMRSFETKFEDMKCRITRCGYTGEDGFEISIHRNTASTLVNALLESTVDDVKPAGLGTRDSLRLEAGLCLYGSDINEDTSPVEAALTWLIGKRRRSLKNFPGASVILNQLKNKPSRKRVGFVSQGPPPRAHTRIYDLNDEEIGEITSGCPSPTRKDNVAMGYVSLKNSKVDTQVQLQIRNKKYPAVVTKMPFVPHRYYGMN